MKIQFERKVNWKTLNIIPQKIFNEILETEEYSELLKNFRNNKKIIKVTYEW